MGNHGEQTYNSPQTVDELLDNLSCYWLDFLPDEWMDYVPTDVLDNMVQKWISMSKPAVERFLKKQLRSS